MKKKMARKITRMSQNLCQIKLCQKKLCRIYDVVKRIYLNFVYNLWLFQKKYILDFCIGFVTIDIFSSWQLCGCQLKCACLLLFSVVDSLSCVIVCCAWGYKLAMTDTTCLHPCCFNDTSFLLLHGFDPRMWDHATRRAFVNNIHRRCPYFVALSL